MIGVEKYCEGKKEDWEALISDAQNGTFLFSRNFMDYHRDRFEDASVLIYDQGECKAVFPANYENGNTVCSHAGLTYGGLVVDRETRSKYVLKYFSALLRHFKEEGIDTLNIKLLPDYYAVVSQQAIEYGLKLADARIYKIDLTCAIDLKSGTNVSMNKVRQWGANKARKNGVSIRETADFSAFWNQVLIPTLQDRHDVTPTHSLGEIQALYDDNNGSIRQFNAFRDGEVLAGATIFETRTAAHTQYIGATREGRKLRALDYLLLHLIHEVFVDKDYFSFGRVNEDSDYSLNVGLLDWKESFGARGFVQRYYSVDTANYPLIEQFWES